MSAEFQFDVFLSHSSKDKAVVRELAERLRKDGLKVWFDEWVLKAGDPNQGTPADREKEYEKLHAACRQTVVNEATTTSGS